MSERYLEKDGITSILYTQVEVDAALALFAQRVAEHNPFVAIESRHGVDHRVWIYCSCGFNRDGKYLDGQPWSEHMLALIAQGTKDIAEGRENG